MLLHLIGEPRAFPEVVGVREEMLVGGAEYVSGPLMVGVRVRTGSTRWIACTGRPAAGVLRARDQIVGTSQFDDVIG